MFLIVHEGAWAVGWDLNFRVFTWPTTMLGVRVGQARILKLRQLAVELAASPNIWTSGALFLRQWVSFASSRAGGSGMIAKTVGTAIVGAGPYGLSIAAHLRARGIQHRIFGRPMVTWLNHMPKSMLLKSDGFASNLSAPAGDHTLRSYCLSHGISYDDYDIPVALTTFTDYALDFQRRFVPEVDERLLTELASRDGGFTLRLEGGERLHAHRVVLAVGISHFDHVPEGLKEHAGRFVSHSSAWKEVSQFLNSDVTIIGGGSSALELAAALHEAGAKARLVIRAPAIRFDSRTPRPSALGLWRRLRHPRSGLGPKSEIVAVFRISPPFSLSAPINPPRHSSSSSRSSIARLSPFCPSESGFADGL